jgi:hypothetical protein
LNHGSVEIDGDGGIGKRLQKIREKNDFSHAYGRE